MLTPEEWQVVVLSLKVAFWSVALSLPFAIAVSWLLARTNFPGKSLFDAMVHLPLVLPPVVVGYMLLLSFGRKGVIGGVLYDWFGFSIVFTWIGAVLACAVMGFPLMVRAIRLSMESIDPKLEQAAKTLGAGGLGRFWAVTLPLALPGVLTGTLLSFARRLGEFGATITFVSNIPGQTRTLPLAIYTLTQVPGGDEQALRLCAISVVLSIAALLVSETLVRRASRGVLGYDAVGRH